MSNFVFEDFEATTVTIHLIWSLRVVARFKTQHGISTSIERNLLCNSFQVGVWLSVTLTARFCGYRARSDSRAQFFILRLDAKQRQLQMSHLSWHSLMSALLSPQPSVWFRVGCVWIWGMGANLPPHFAQRTNLQHNSKSFEILSLVQISNLKQLKDSLSGYGQETSLHEQYPMQP